MLRILVALAVLSLGPSAWACGPDVKPANFEMGEKGWGEADGQFRIDGSEAVFTPEPGTQTARWNAGLEVANVDACVTIVMPESANDASRGYAGLMFWVTDKDNFHQAVISRNGMVTVARKVAGRIVAAPPINWLQTSALKLEPDAKNTLRVTVEGQNVVVHVNDTEVARFRGQAPQRASHVGLVASSAPSAVDTWRMTDFKAAEVAAPAAADTAIPSGDTTGAVNPAPTTNCGTGQVLFEDKFTEHDPMWGMKNAEVRIADGEAEFDPTPGTPTLRWNRAFVFGDLDACASVRLAKETNDPTASYAGLLFWVEDSRNYYQAVIAPNGYFTVARIVDGKAVAKRPIAWTKVGAVKTGAKERNTLRLIVKGGDVQVLINGQPAGSFRAEAPRGPSYVGMLAASAATKKGDTWSISGLRVTAPE